jgi:hypothetical protein
MEASGGRCAGWRVLGLTVVAGLLVVLAGVMLSQPVGASLQGVMFVLPALLMALVLVAKRYPGERVIERLRALRVARRQRPASVAVRLRPRSRVRPRGGRLIAVSLAGRAPPLAAGCR